VSACNKSAPPASASHYGGRRLRWRTQPRPAIFGQLVGMAAEEARDLGLQACASSARARCATPRSMDRKTSLAGQL